MCDSRLGNVASLNSLAKAFVCIEFRVGKITKTRVQRNELNNRNNGVLPDSILSAVDLARFTVLDGLLEQFGSAIFVGFIRRLLRDY